MQAGGNLDELNPAQRAAVEHGAGRSGAPLLIIAGAGTGKTHTLAHRVAHLIQNGAEPGRVLLLTFTRRAAAEMTRRAQRILQRARSRATRSPLAAEIRWSGTFTASATGCSRA